jgi:hypothetical protein
MKGGYRAGAGRKKGYSAIESEKAREFIVQRVTASLEPIVQQLIKRAKEGDIRAIRELFDRAYGKSIQTPESVFNPFANPIRIINVSATSQHRYRGDG